MADIYSFFEEGIKSYLEQSFSKYSKNTDIIFHRSFDNNFLNPIFINDISLYKNLIQKNKLKIEIWGLICKLFDEKINLILNKYNESEKIMESKVLKYRQKIKKSNELINNFGENVEGFKKEIENNNDKLKKEDQEKNINIEEKDDLGDVKSKEEIAKMNSDLIKKITDYNKNREEEEKKLKKYEDTLKNRKIYVKMGEINILKLKILLISVDILINEISSQETNNKFKKENNYKMLNDYISDFIDKSEKIKDSRYIEYTAFIKSYVIKLVLIINNQGYKDINKSFLNQLLNIINNIKEKYSNSLIFNLIKYIENLISSPDKFLCRNAFSILKKASFKKLAPRSRNNSFDKNDLVNNNNINNKNEKNRKIDEFMTLKTEEKSDSEEYEECYQKKLSNVISFKNSSMLNNNSNTNMAQSNYMNQNFQSQSSLGLGDMNKHRSYPNDSAMFSNNSLIHLENQNGTNLLNSSKISLDDSMSFQGIYRSGSYSDLLGINSRLVSQLPAKRNTRKEKKTNILETFKKKIKIKKQNIKRKRSNENLDKIFGKEIRKMNFYNEENEINKNTTATDTKINKNKEEKVNNSKKTTSNILVSKTPIKAGEENLTEKEQIIKSNNLKDTGIKRNLEFLFNQQTDKY